MTNENGSSSGFQVDLPERQFDWPLCYEAENFLLAQTESFLQRNSFARRLAERMHDETGTLFLDWIDHLVVAKSQEAAFRQIGFVDDPLGEVPASQRPLWHPKALLPRVIIDTTIPTSSFPAAVAVRPESLIDFLAANRVQVSPEGAPLSRFRRVTVASENQTLLQAVERRGYRGYLPEKGRAEDTATLLLANERWQTRQRAFADDSVGFQQTLALLDEIVEAVGPDLACHIAFAGERLYWQQRNRAAQIQKWRQDRLGLGWGNHDHHTFRSSRQHFVHLMQALEKLGFERRERYYTGEQAGWGAQILEQPVEGIVAFCDVDLMPGDTEIDFSRQPLPPANRLGTIGLWVGLHGESFLESGMHHLECRFDFDSLRKQLADERVATMKPFSDFPFLRQAFTEGERWPVRRERAEKLRESGLITAEQCQEFLTAGALGSHLENLQRKGGYKGFNQKSVSVIIRATDPRRVPSS